MWIQDTTDLLLRKRPLIVRIRINQSSLNINIDSEIHIVFNCSFFNNLMNIKILGNHNTYKNWCLNNERISLNLTIDNEGEKTEQCYWSIDRSRIRRKMNHLSKENVATHMKNFYS